MGKKAGMGTDKKRPPIIPAWIVPGLANRRGEEPQSQENMFWLETPAGLDLRLPQRHTADTFSGPTRTIGAVFSALIGSIG